jgi:hypothetical protein
VHFRSLLAAGHAELTDLLCTREAIAVDIRNNLKRESDWLGEAQAGLVNSFGNGAGLTPLLKEDRP